MMGWATMRADKWLVEQKLVASRQKAKELIETGAVRADGVLVKKPNQTVSQSVNITIDSPLQNWVSRGALKLLGGFDAFDKIQAKDKICLDLGASTGGFTQVLLSKGASLIYAVDVGHGQLAQNLSDDERVRNFEKVNARYLEQSNVPNDFQLIVCDVSFISLKIALLPALQIAQKQCQLLALIKPQFEVGRAGLDKGGIVKDDRLRQQCVDEISNWIQAQGWHLFGIDDSPITGPDGNHEYLIAAEKR